MVWPPWANYNIIHGANGFSYACEKLRASTTSERPEAESELVQIILTRASASQSVAVVSSLCRVAVTWNDLSLWLRALKACDAERSIAALGGENRIYQAISRWGFESIKPV